MHSSTSHPKLATGVAYGSLLALCLILTGCGGGAPESPQNVLLITLDTTRADYLSTYGYLEETTPNLDALARQGTRFDLAISTAAVTPVSHASILTGLYNHEHGLRVLSAPSGFRLPSDVATLASVLQDYGYSTLAVHSAFPVSAHFGLDQGFEVFESFDTTIQIRKGEREKHSWPLRQLQRRSDATTDLVLQHLAAVQEPFFLWVHYWDPHDRMILPPDDFMPEDIGDNNGTRRNRKIYAAEIRYMDSQIGRLLDHLVATGIDDRTLVIVISDHGEGLGNHGWGKHRILYQEQIRLPLIIRIPGRDQAPVVSALVRSIDIFPTVLDYLGIGYNVEVSGQSLRALIEGRQEPGRVALADQINGFDLNADMVATRPLDDFLYSAMDQDWKLIYRPANPDASELFNLSQDPKERQNLYAQRPEEAQRLLAVLARSEPWVTTPFTPAGDAGDLEAIQEALTALGYLGGSNNAATGLDWAWACPDNLGRLRRDRRQGDCPTPLVPVLPRPDDGS